MKGYVWENKYQHVHIGLNKYKEMEIMSFLLKNIFVSSKSYTSSHGHLWLATLFMAAILLYR